MNAVLELSDVSSDYRGLRPLRIERLVVAEREQIAILGLDEVTAEIFVNLVTGAALPDRGDVKLFGRSTASIDDSAGWLASVDRFGIVSRRAVLLESLSVLQNLAMPFTLEIEPPADDVRERAAALAREVGLADADVARPVGALNGPGRARLRLGRALALDPAIVLLEHPTAELPREDVEAFGRDVRDVVARRGAASIALTVDEAFARAVAARVLRLEAATGKLTERRARWFRRG